MGVFGSCVLALLESQHGQAQISQGHRVLWDVALEG